MTISIYTLLLYVLGFIYVCVALWRGLWQQDIEMVSFMSMLAQGFLLGGVASTIGLAAEMAEKEWFE